MNILITTLITVFDIACVTNKIPLIFYENTANAYLTAPYALADKDCH